MTAPLSIAAWEAAAARVDGGRAPPAGVWRVQLWRDRLWGSGHTATWTTDGSGDGWWWDSVDGRAFDARLRSWAEVTREARAGLRAVRLTAP